MSCKSLARKELACEASSSLVVACSNAFSFFSCARSCTAYRNECATTADSESNLSFRLLLLLVLNDRFRKIPLLGFGSRLCGFGVLLLPSLQQLCAARVSLKRARKLGSTNEGLNVLQLRFEDEGELRVVVQRHLLLAHVPLRERLLHKAEQRSARFVVKQATEP